MDTTPWPTAAGPTARQTPQPASNPKSLPCGAPSNEAPHKSPFNPPRNPPSSQTNLHPIALSGGLAALADEIRQVWDGRLAGDAEPGSEIVPEAEAELGAGLGEAEEGVAAVAARVAASATADLSAGDLGADVVLRAVGVQRG